MKRRMAAIACGLWMLLAASVQGSGIGGFAGYWEPADTGSGNGFGGRLATTGDPSGRLELRISRFSDLTTVLPEGSIEVQATPVEFGMILNLNDDKNMQLYGGVGAGYYMYEAVLTDSHGRRDVDMEDRWGYYGLMGVEIPLSDRLSAFGEGVYRRTRSRVRGERLAPAGTTRSMKFDGIGAHAGLMLQF